MVEASSLLDDIQKDWVPFAEVQTALRCSRSTVSRLIASRILIARKLGKEKWIKRDSIRQYLDSVFRDEQPREVRRLKRR